MADILPEKWMRGVAVTTTVLAVLTAIASSRAAHSVAVSQILTAQEGSQWAYYQAKSVKENLAETQRGIFEVEFLGATTPSQKTLLEKNLGAAQSLIARYEQEKDQIKKEAEDIGKENNKIRREGDQFNLSVVFFQIGIMLSSVSALLKRKEMWVIGVLFGCIAAVFLVDGIFLFF